MSKKPLDEEALFHAARQIPAGEARDVFVAQACMGDNRLAERVSVLLEMHEQEPDSESNPAAEMPTVEQPSVSEYPGSQIGPYRLREKIGEGGFGLVFVAEQTEPVKRKVALKIIKPGMDTQEVIARFSAERQALALMDHPNIARVLDAGATESGRPYFVMELVRGVPITEYCDQNLLTPRSRLDLFVTVCQAVQHAHQKGIIHRDIKPSNVMVTSHDGKPVAKVIDFGVAKAMHQQLTDRSIYTNFAQMIGTPLYMSPEQAEMSGLDIDTRSDIYSLGVLLYELLTGTTPLEKKRFKEAACDEIRRLIREEEPQKPSTRLSTSDSIASVAAQRHSEPAKLSKLVRGDLDWITMKALEKDRTRRYETANGFAADVSRYLDGEPVLAAPPSTGYRLRKFLRRHRGQVVAAGVVVLGLLVGVVGTTIGLFEAKRQQRLAEAAQSAEAERAEGERKAKEKAQNAADAEKAARLDEERERKFAEAIADFVKDDFLGLTSVEGQDRFGGEFGSEGLDRNATLMTLLDRAGTKLKMRKDLAPRIEAELSWIVGVNYRGAGEPAKGVPFLERAVELRRSALGVGHVDTLDAMNSLAVCYNSAGQRDKALLLYEQTLKLQQENLGVNHPNTLATMKNLAGCYEDAGQLNRSLPLFEQTLELFKKHFGPHHTQTLNSMNALAVSYLTVGQYEKALPLFEQTLTLRRLAHGADHPKTILATYNLAGGYRASGQLEKALPLFEQSFELSKEKLGLYHPDTLGSMSGLALCYQQAGQLEKALPLFEQSCELLEEKLGLYHPLTIARMSDLASCYEQAGQLEKALPLFEKSLELSKEKLGPHHLHTLTIMSNLAGGYSAAGQLEKAILLFERVLELQKEHLGADHFYTIRTMNNLAQQGYHAAGQFDKSLPLQEAALEAVKRTLGPDHRHTLSSMTNLADALTDAEKVEQAVPLYEQALKAARVKFGTDDWYTLGVMRKLAVVYRESGQLDKALPMFEETLKGLAKLDPDHPHALDIMGNLAMAYEASSQFEKAEFVQRERLSLVKAKSGGDSPAYAAALARLGLNQLSQKKWRDAEPILRECLAIREKKEPDDWWTFNTQSMLGGSLLGQKKYAESEPLLLKGYEGMKAREKTIPPQGAIRIPEALDRLIEFYIATDKPEEAQKWQAERAKYPLAAPGE